jgi:hypothetical protein
MPGAVLDKMNVKSCYHIAVQLQNICRTSFYPPLSEDPSVNLSYHWFDVERKPVVWDGARAILHNVLKPGHVADLQICVKTPETVGQYVLQWDLVIEGFSWFSGHGWQGPVHRILVVHERTT